MNVYIGGTKDYSAMRGPCPSGFHVPLYTEWIGLRNIMYGLGLTTGDNWRINLHIPFAGRRGHYAAGLNAQGSYGSYWSSSPYLSSNPTFAYHLYLYSSGLDAKYTNYRAEGFSVRCFKNSFEKPTSSWIVISGTLGSSGIFWNQTEGLISITSDGTTGYTIQDKNLGATTVYNNGDTLSEANCGKYYQWGNNYGFAWTGSVTTSSTQVNAGSYGPGNYYSSSTFITRSSTPYDWSSVQNDNLRGGVTGVVMVPAELKNAYIGEVYEYNYDFRNKTTTNLTNDGWSVGANTTIDSNGITSSSFSSTTHEIGHSITNAKKITLTCGLYNANVTNSSYGLWGTKSSGGTHYAVFYVDGATSGSSALSIDGANVQVFTQTEPSGQSEWTYTLDFENLTYKLEYAGVTKSGTMTQTQANNIRNNNTAIRLAAQHGAGRIQYVKILVE